MNKQIFLCGLLICLLSPSKLLYSVEYYSPENTASAYQLISQKLLTIEQSEAKQSKYFAQTKSSNTPLDLFNEITSSESLSVAAKEFLLFELARNLKNQPLSSSEQVLNLLIKQKTIIRTSLNDGGHQQIIIPYPVSGAAKASLNYLKMQEQSHNLLELIKSADFSTLELTTEFLQQKKLQLLIIRNLITELTQQEAEEFIQWSLDKKDIGLESKLVVALKARNQTAIQYILKQAPTIPLQHYLPSIIQQWPAEQQLEILKSISTNKNYASQVTYYVSRLDIDHSLKIDFWFAQLTTQLSSASAAHQLANHMDDDIAARLFDKAGEPDSSQVLKNVVLALGLSQHEAAKDQLNQLIKLNKLPANLVKEVSKW